METFQKNIKKLAKEKLDLTEEDVIDWIKRHTTRVALNGLSFFFQFSVIFLFMTDRDWDGRHPIIKLWVLFVVILLMIITESIRFSDFLLEKYGYLDEKSGASGQSSSASNRTSSGSSSNASDVTKRSSPVSSPSSSRSSSPKDF